jgi:hypothetical protein
MSQLLDAAREAALDGCCSHVISLRTLVGINTTSTYGALKEKGRCMLGPLTLWRSLAVALLKRREETASRSLSRERDAVLGFWPLPSHKWGTERIMPVSGCGDQSLDYLSDAFYCSKLGQTPDPGNHPKQASARNH